MMVFKKVIFFKKTISSKLGIAALLLAPILFSACDGKVHVSESQYSDFSKSEIISGGPVIADGSSELLVAIQLMNAKGDAIKLFKPTYAITSGAGVQGSECTSSNSNGVSTCILKSTQPGVKRLSVTNIRMSLYKDIEFTAPVTSGAVTGVVAGAKYNNKAATGHSISGTVGSVHSDIVLKSSSGWKIFGGPEGNAFSQ